MKVTIKTIKILINTSLLGQKKGSIVTLTTDRAGKVINAFWAARIKDAEIDHCVSIITASDASITDKTTPKKGKK